MHAMIIIIIMISMIIVIFLLSLLLLLLPAAEHNSNHLLQLFRDKSFSSSILDPHVSMKATCSSAVAATSGTHRAVTSFL